LWALKATAGAAVLLLATGGVAYGQAAAPAPDQAASAAAKSGDQTLQTVVVTGIRKGIEDAIAVKKNSDSIVEAVSAEDIGKLPDSSIAESLARLPGTAAQRVNGRATSVSIRGFSPDFSTALLNGREQVSTGDSRYVEFDQYPSELLTGVTVYKTPDGSLIGQGLSGTVDMQTARPLNFGSRVIATSYRGEQLGKGIDTPSGHGNRFNLAYIDQFADRTFGVALGYARLSEKTGVTQNFSDWGVNDVCPVANVNGACPTATLGKAPGGFNDLVDQSDQKRDAVMATLQYKPNKNFQSTLDYFYTKFDIVQLEQGAQVPLAPAFPEWGQNYGGTTVSNMTVSNGVITSGTIDGFKGVSRNDSTATHDKVYSLGWNNKLAMGDWTGTLDLATSEAKRDQPHLETTAGIPGNCKTDPAPCGSISWSGFDGSHVGGATYTPSISLGDTSQIKLTDVEGWGGNISNGASTTPQAGYSKRALTDDKLNQYRFDLKRDLPEGWWFVDADVGVNFSDRTKTREYIEGRLLVGAANDPFAAVNVPGGTVATAPHSGLQYVAWNPDGSIGPIYTVAEKLVGDIVNKDWTVKEKVTTLFTRLDIDQSLGSIPVRGNVGLQVVHTKQSSDGFLPDTTNCPSDVCNTTPEHAEKSYNDVLPSLNLVGDLGNGQTLRFGLGRQMARPQMNDERDTFNPTQAGGGSLAKVVSGNTQLNPWRANAVDLSYEKYFGTKAYFSAAVFYKDLSSYILNVARQADLAPYGITPDQNGSTTGIFIQPQNGSGGHIDGLELAASMPLQFISPWLNGFGIQANYGLTSSSVQLPVSGFNVQNISSLTIPLPGLSKKTAGLTAYYEKAGFSARVAGRYRSDFVGQINDQFGDQSLVFIKAERIVDAQLGYEFQSGMLKNLSILLQANNLNNAPYVEFDPTTSSEHRTVYGKTYLFGLSYKL
jgi:iron complex outermembrane receptor protein